MRSRSRASWTIPICSPRSNARRCALLSTRISRSSPGNTSKARAPRWRACRIRPSSLQSTACAPRPTWPRSPRDFAKAEANLRKSQQLLERNGNTRGLLYHAVLTDLGGVLFRTSRFREALALNEITAEALDRNGRGGTLGRVTVSMNRASLLMRLGEVNAAEAAGGGVDPARATIARQRTRNTPASDRVRHHAESIGSPGRGTRTPDGCA